MLNKKSSSQSPAWKLSLIMPIILAFMLLFNVKTEAQVIDSEKKSSVVIESGKALTISAETSVEMLKKLEDFFNADGIILKFMNLKYDSGKIISINSEMTDPVKGITTTYNQSRSTGIKPFKVSVNKDGSMGYETLENAENFTVDTHNKFKELGENPLFMINGKPVKPNYLKGKYIKIEGSIEVKTGVNATSSFGLSGKDGAVIISDAEILNEFTDDSSFKGDPGFSQKYIMFNEQGKPFPMKLETRINPPKNFESENKETDIKVTGVEFSTEDEDEIRETLSSDDIIGGTVVGYQYVEEPKNHLSGSNQLNNEINPSEIFIKQAKPLVILNGIIQDEDYDYNVLDPKNIANIKIIKGTGAIEKYGKKAIEGVVEVTTKDFENTSTESVNVNLHVIHKDQNNSSLENLRKMIKEDVNIETEFSNIKRNASGIITSIKIKAETTSGKKASASFSNSKGIPLFIIGLDKKGQLIISSNYKTF